MANDAVAARTAFIYHMCPKDAWEKAKKGDSGTYTPDGFEKDGFIHATSVASALVNVANHFYKRSTQEWICLEIDVSACAPIEVVWENPASVAGSSLTGTEDEVKPSKENKPGMLFPHIYGALNIAAVVKVYPMCRDEDGAFLSIPGVTQGEELGGKNTPRMHWQYRIMAFTLIVLISGMVIAILWFLGVRLAVAILPGLAALAGSVDALFGGWSGLLMKETSIQTVHDAGTGKTKEE